MPDVLVISRPANRCEGSTETACSQCGAIGYLAPSAQAIVARGGISGNGVVLVCFICAGPRSPKAPRYVHRDQVDDVVKATGRARADVEAAFVRHGYRLLGYG